MNFFLFQGKAQGMENPLERIIVDGQSYENRIVFAGGSAIESDFDLRNSAFGDIVFCEMDPTTRAMTPLRENV
jgi:hypothetical protein